VKPLVDGGATYVRYGSFSERGAGAANLDVDSRTETYLSVRPALEIGGELGSADGMLFRPYVRAGATHFFTGTEPSVAATLRAAPSGVAPFRVSGESDDTYADVEAGVEMLMKGGISFELSYEGRFSDNLSSNGGSLKLTIPF